MNYKDPDGSRVELYGGPAADALPELADPAAEAAAGGRQTLGAEDEQRDDGDDRQFHGSDVGHGASIDTVPGRA